MSGSSLHPLETVSCSSSRSSLPVPSMLSSSAAGRDAPQDRMAAAAVKLEDASKNSSSCDSDGAPQRSKRIKREPVVKEEETTGKEVEEESDANPIDAPRRSKRIKRDSVVKKEGKSGEEQESDAKPKTLSRLNRKPVKQESSKNQEYGELVEEEDEWEDEEDEEWEDEEDEEWKEEEDEADVKPRSRRSKKQQKEEPPKEEMAASAEIDILLDEANQDYHKYHTSPPPLDPNETLEEAKRKLGSCVLLRLIQTKMCCRCGKKLGMYFTRGYMEEGIAVSTCVACFDVRRQGDWTRSQAEKGLRLKGQCGWILQKNYTPRRHADSGWCKGTPLFADETVTAAALEGYANSVWELHYALAMYEKRRRK